MAAFPEWLGDVTVPDDLEAVYEANKTLQELSSVSAQPIGPLMRSLVNAVAVLGHDMVYRSLTIMAARPPVERMRGLDRCEFCHKPKPAASLYKRFDDRVLCADCYYHADEQQRMIDRMVRETTQGTAVAPNKRLPYPLYGGFAEAARRWEIEPIDPTKVDYTKPVTVHVTAPTSAADVIREALAGYKGVSHDEPVSGYLGQALEAIRPTLEEKMARALDAAEKGATGGPDWREVIDPATARHINTARGDTVEFNVKLYAPPDLGHYDESEAEVDEAVTPEIAALLADGDVVGAQRLILEGLEAYHKPEAVTVPPGAPVYAMPAPRAGSRPLVRISYDADTDKTPIEPQPTGKPCAVCMRPAFFINERGSKPRHFCKEHKSEAGL